MVQIQLEENNFEVNYKYFLNLKFIKNKILKLKSHNKIYVLYIYIYIYNDTVLYFI